MEELKKEFIVEATHRIYTIGGLVNAWSSSVSPQVAGALIVPAILLLIEMTVKHDKKEVINLKTEWQIFADEYIISLNATQSYLKAYPEASYETARANGCTLLANTSIKAYIDEQMAKKQDDRIMKQDEILRLLTSIARGEQTEQTLKGEGNGYQVLVNKDISAKDRLKALELLGKRYGTFTEKIDVSVGKSEKLADIMDQLKGE